MQDSETPCASHFSYFSVQFWFVVIGFLVVILAVVLVVVAVVVVVVVECI